MENSECPKMPLASISREHLDINHLPNELLLKVIQYLPAHDMVMSANKVCFRWRSLIIRNLSRVQRIPAYCHVKVVDVDLQTDNKRAHGHDTTMQYRFSTYNTKKTDYQCKRRNCLSGNDKSLKSIRIAYRCGEMNAQFESRGTVEELDGTTAARLLSYLDVMELRVDVLKKRRSLTGRHVDERFAEAITFCEKMCGKVDLKSLSLRSQNPHFAWCMGKESLKRLSSFQNLESLSLENMVEADVLDYVEVVVDLKKLSNIRMRLDARHLGEVEGIRWVNIQGSFLSSLANAHAPSLYFSAFFETPGVIVTITASDLCHFVKLWRTLPVPWVIKSILFNSTITAHEFFTVATSQGVYDDTFTYTPFTGYCTHHPSDPNMKLQLGCYVAGIYTRWRISAGNLTS